MSAQVCYVRRDAGGRLLAGVRLSTAHEQAVLDLPETSGGEDSASDAGAAAAFLAQHLPSAKPSIDLLCLDTQASLCSWLATPSGDEAVVSALARGAAASPAGEQGERLSPLAVYAATPLEAHVQSLGAAAPSGRAAVLALGDVAGRLLIDALDARGVEVRGVVSLWQALALAWGDRQEQRTDEQNAGRVVAQQAGDLAVVLVEDPDRLSWVWARGTLLLCAGRQRLSPGAAPEGGGAGAQLGPEHAARLAAEWLAWSAQIGAAPARVLVIAPPSEGAAAFGRALTAAWSGAAVDLALDQDPVGATLRRLARGLDEQRITPREQDVPALTARPRRAHQRMLGWTAGAVAALAGVCGVAALQLHAQAAGSRRQAAELAQRSSDLIVRQHPDVASKPQGQHAFHMQAKLNELRRRSEKNRAEPSMPVLPEAVTLAQALGRPEIQLVELALPSSGFVRVRVRLERSVEQVEHVKQLLERAPGSRIIGWTESQPREAGSGPVVYEFTGRWAPVKKSGAGGGL